jgi:hypothetical protein
MRDPFAPVAMVSVTDPAIYFDSEADREKYRLTRDPALVKVREHAVPAWIEVAPTSAAFALYLDGIKAAPVVAYLLAVRACVRAVQLPTGERIEPQNIEPGVYDQHIASEAWIETLARKIGPRRVQEIGEAAYRLSMLDDIDPLSQPLGQHLQS